MQKVGGMDSQVDAPVQDRVADVRQVPAGAQSPAEPRLGGGQSGCKMRRDDGGRVAGDPGQLPQPGEHAGGRPAHQVDARA
jgi:hypothetical protein